MPAPRTRDRGLLRVDGSRFAPLQLPVRLLTASLEPLDINGKPLAIGVVALPHRAVDSLPIPKELVYTSTTLFNRAAFINRVSI
jgi:hypothetical protein